MPTPSSPTYRAELVPFFFMPERRGPQDQHCCSRAEKQRQQDVCGGERVETGQNANEEHRSSCHEQGQYEFPISLLEFHDGDRHHCLGVGPTEVPPMIPLRCMASAGVRAKRRAQD